MEKFRGKEKLEQLPCEQFLQAFEIYHALLRAKHVGENRGKIQNHVKIALKAVVLFFSFPLELRQYKNGFVSVKRMFVLKLPPFFPCRLGE